jgi:hypothetical protein
MSIETAQRKLDQARRRAVQRGLTDVQRTNLQLAVDRAEDELRRLEAQRR